MITIVLIGAMTAVAMFAILLKLSPSETKKADKLEKGQIIKQLLAMSELENRTTKAKAPIPPRPPRADTAGQDGNSSQLKAMGRTSCVT